MNRTSAKPGGLLVRYCTLPISVLSLFLIACSKKTDIAAKSGWPTEKGKALMDTTYPDNFDLVSEHYDDVGFDKLTEQEKLVYCIWCLEGEVNNGGFHQFFSNSAGDHTNETLKALEVIGAMTIKKLLGRAVAIAFDGKPAPSDRNKREKLLERPTKEADQELFRALDALDEEFVEYEDPIENLVNEWLSKQE